MLFIFLANSLTTKLKRKCANYDCGFVDRFVVLFTGLTRDILQIVFSL